MAFHMGGLPSIMAVTTELWTTVPRAVKVPPAGRLQHLSRQQCTRKFSLSTVTPFRSYNLPVLPREIPTPVTTASAAGAVTTTTSSPRALVSGIPWTTRNTRHSDSSHWRGPLCLGLRSVHTSVQSQRSTAFSHDPSVASPSSIQYRGFGTGGLSRSLLASREAAANRNPNSATAQNAFYQVLLKANMPAIILERYQSGRFATNEATDQAYQKALAAITGSGSSSLPSAGHTGAGGLSPSQLQTVGQAIAAHTQGGNISVANVGQATGAKDGPLHVVVDESMGSTVFRWVKFIMWFCLFSYLSLVVVSMVIEWFNTVKRPGAKTGNAEAKPEHQKARFSDVHGCDEAKEELQDLVEFLRNPDKFSALGGKLPKGVLLVGPPGTGKTLLARAVAGEAGVPFFYMSGSEFDEVYVGVGAKRVRDLFAQAKAKSPAIVFIDELDAIGGRRNNRDMAYAKQTLNQLLTELDGFDQNSNVIILGATNFPKSLDKALTRPGRFDRHVVVSLPDVRGRIAILKHHAKKIKMGTDVNLEAIAGGTSGFSGADLENVVNQAAIHASKRKAQSVTHRDMDYAKDKLMMGAEKTSMVITPAEKEMTAYHEAGHALVAYFNKESTTRLYKVTILPRGQALGITSFLPEMDKHSHSVRDYLAMIDRAMGGKVAEEIVYGHDLVTSGVSSDLDSATKVAWQMVGQLGMSAKMGPVEYLRRFETLSSETKSMLESEVKRVLEDSYQRTRDLLVSRRKELDLLAKALVEYETLDKSEVDKVLRGEKLLDRVPVPPGPMAIPKRPDLEGEIPGLPPLPDKTTDGSDNIPPPAVPPGSPRSDGTR